MKLDLYQIANIVCAVAIAGLTVTALVLAVSPPTDTVHALRLLKAQGYTDIRFEGYGGFECGRGDVFSTPFRAKSITNADVAGTVCKGWLTKSSTIRLF